MAAIRTKICGITRTIDAEMACEAGADAIGLNFYAKSKRFVDTETAAVIADCVGERLAVFGVFVNAAVEDIANVCSKVALSHVQFHGDESASVVHEIKAAMPKAKVVRAVRIMNNDFESAQREIDQWQAAGVDIVLLDAASIDAFGGTGKRLDWEKLEQLNFEVPWVLAGGLNATNVCDAIELAKPSGVDVASGVESAPGIKATELVQSFVANSISEFSIQR